MATKKRSETRKFFTLNEANAALPLIRVIVRDIVELARELRDRHEKISRYQHSLQHAGPRDISDEDLDQAKQAFETESQRMHEYERELANLGVELKDYFTGLVDFPSLHEGREVYLCWRLGEPQVDHWHELDAGFAGRQKVSPEVFPIN